MALAFMLNPSRRKRRVASCRSKTRGKRRRRLYGAALASHRARCRHGVRRMHGRKPRSPWRRGSVAWRRARKPKTSFGRKEKIVITPTERELEAGKVFTLNNPRKKRRGKKGGPGMAKRTKRRGKRAKMYRNRKGRFTRRKSGKRVRYHSKGRKRGWWNNNPRHKRRKNARRSRRRNPLMVRGGMYSNPRRRRNARRSRRRNPLMVRGGMYSNPRRRKNAHRRRRNPFSLGGTFRAIQTKLTSPASLMQAGAAAAGATVSEFLGSILASKIASFAPQTFTGMFGTVLQAASRIAAGVLVAGFLPARFQGAFALGASAMAAKPFVDMALGPVLAGTGLAVPVASTSGMGGIGGWITVGQARRIGQSGIGAYMTSNQMRRLANGTAGLGDYSWGYGQPVTSMQDYARQPAAALQSAMGF